MLPMSAYTLKFLSDKLEKKKKQLCSIVITTEIES